MTFLEAALEILRRERKPLHYKDIAQKAMDRKLLTFVGRTPEVTMQTQLTAAVKKSPGAPFVRVKPGTFGLLRYPEGAPAPEPEPKDKEKDRSRDRDKDRDKAAAPEGGRAERGERGRRRRRGGRGRTRREDKPTDNGATTRPRAARGETMTEEEDNAGNEATRVELDDEPEIGSLSPEARAAALAESGVLESQDDDDDDELDEDDRDDQDEAGAATAGADDDGSDEEGAGPEDDDDSDEDDDDDDDSDEDDDDDEEDDEGQGDDEEAQGEQAPRAATPAAYEPPSAFAAKSADEPGAGARARADEDEGEEGDDEAGSGHGRADEAAAGAAEPGGAFDEGPGGRRRRRRRRRRGGGEGGMPATSGQMSMYGEGGGLAAGGAPGLAGARAEGGEGLAVGESSTGEPLTGGAPAPSDNDGAIRRIMSPIDAAIEILRGQSPGRGLHVRQLAEAATRRRLVHGEPNEAWRVMRAALAAEPRERLRSGLRPRVRAAGSGLFALTRRPPDLDLERAEHVFGEARRALRERTLAGLEQRLTELSPSAFEAIARVLLQREGFGPATFVKRVEGTVYLECLRGRGARPSRCLVALRPGGSSAGRRSVGELRAGIRARNQDEGVLLLAARLAEDAIAEWKQPGPPIEVADGAALAETCVRHGVGVTNATVSVDFVDADFFAELQEG
jgi:hypothetical protein